MTETPKPDDGSWKHPPKKPYLQTVPLGAEGKVVLQVKKIETGYTIENNSDLEVFIMPKVAMYLTLPQTIADEMRKDVNDTPDTNAANIEEVLIEGIKECASYHYRDKMIEWDDAVLFALLAPHLAKIKRYEEALRDIEENTYEGPHIRMAHEALSETTPAPTHESQITELKEQLAKAEGRCQWQPQRQRNLID